MQSAPKGLRLHIGIFGRRNSGKSTLLNALANQETAIVSSTPGTTTDPVEKTMEIAGLGPVVIVDTAGIDDEGSLGEKRIRRANAMIERMDLAIVVTEGQNWEEWEELLIHKIKSFRIPFIIALNKSDLGDNDAQKRVEQFRSKLESEKEARAIPISAKTGHGISALLDALKAIGPKKEKKSILADLASQGGAIVFVVPIDSGAPEGRLILPQVMSLRDALDHGKICLVLTENLYEAGLKKLAQKPDLVVCDSQVVQEVAKATPSDIPLTTFSILMARLKGDLVKFAAGAASLAQIKPGDRILIQEACSHHPQKDDIGRVKIPRLLKKMAGGEIRASFSAGRESAEYDKNLTAIIHCGACTITPKQMLARQERAFAETIPMTNYGMTISLAQGVIERALSPYPEAFQAFQNALRK